MSTERIMTREFFRSLSRNKTYAFAPVRVVDYGDAWEVSHEFDELDVQEIYRMEKIGERLSFSEAYKMRWMENAKPDSKGEYWLMTTVSTRTPIWQWARDRGYYIEFEEGDFEIQKIKMPCV